MFEYHGQSKVIYKFTESPQSLLNDLQNQEIHDINEAIKEGNPHPKCKKMGLIKGRFTPHLQPYHLKASRRHSAGPATPENNRTLSSRGWEIDCFCRLAETNHHRGKNLVILKNHWMLLLRILRKCGKRYKMTEEWVMWFSQKATWPPTLGGCYLQASRCY